VTSFFLGGAVALGLLLFLPLFRIVRGPTLYDRLVGASVMATKTTVLLVLMGHAVGRADMYVDISLGYGLALLVGTLVATKYLESVVIQDPAARDGARDERPPKDATA
jgi:multicomponent Na+:H+ antiporter subunit F